MPALPDAGVPASTPPVVSVTPPGSALAVVNVGGGAPVAVTVNVPAAATVKVVVAALVKTGEVKMFSVNVGNGAFEFPDVPHVGSQIGRAHV